MSYCPECCSDDVDGIKHGNKRFYICGVCGAEWVEVDNYGLPSAEHPQHKCMENPPPAQMIKSNQ
jgi:hypothetical protein